ncbi:heme exporter protein CcmD [Rhodoblastus sp.]
MKDYSSYIFAAYGFAAVLVGFVTVRIVLDYRELKKQLARFDEREKGQ